MMAVMMANLLTAYFRAVVLCTAGAMFANHIILLAAANSHPFRIANSDGDIIPDRLDRQPGGQWNDVDNNADSVNPIKWQQLEQESVAPAGVRRLDENAADGLISRGTLDLVEDQRNGRQLLPNSPTWLNNIVRNFDVFGIAGGLAAQVDLVAAGDSGVSGTLTLNQSHALANVRIQGTITGLKDSEEINIHNRRLADISDDCANQGDFRNPHQTSAAGGFLVKSSLADETGTVTLDENVPAVDISLYLPWGILKRSVRVSSGSSEEGDVLACGIVVPLDQVVAPGTDDGAGSGNDGGSSSGSGS